MKDELEAVKKMSLADIEKELAKCGKPKPAKENPINGHEEIQGPATTRPPQYEKPTTAQAESTAQATTTTGEPKT